MESRKIALIAAACWLAAAAPVALAAADGAKADAKDAAAESPAKKAGDDSGAKGVKPAGPHLQMRAHRGKNPGKDRDLRHCLDLTTDKEVIRCTEQK